MSPKYVVVNENILGYWMQNNTIGILHASTLKGATTPDIEGWIYPPIDRSKIRPATKDDFIEFRVMAPPDL